MPAWAYLVVVIFVGLLAWPTLESYAFRLLRRARRRASRGRKQRGRGAIRPAKPADRPKGADSLAARIRDSRRKP